MTLPARFVVLVSPSQLGSRSILAVQPFNLAGFCNRSNPTGYAA